MNILTLFASVIILQTSQIASVPGADMTMYDLYTDNLRDNRNKAMEYAELFLNGLSRPVANETVAAISDSLSAFYENELYQFTKAIQWAELSLESYQTIGNKLKTAESEYRLAKLYFQKGLYNKTLLYATEAQEVFKTYKDSTRLLDCYNMLGAVYYICRDFETSNKYFQLFANGARAMKDSVRLVYALNNSAQHSRSIKDTSKATSLYMESIRLCHEIRDSSLLCFIYLNLADSYMESEKYSKAEKCLDKAKPLVREIDNRGHYYRSLGILRMLQGDSDEAIKHLRTAIESYSKGEFEIKRQFCLDVLHPIYADEGRYVEAYNTLNEYFIADKSNSSKKVYLELFRAQNEIKFNSEKERLREQKSRHLLTFLLLVSITAIVMLIIMLRVKKRSYSIRQKEIEVKNQELLNEKKENEIRTKNEILEIRKMQQYQMDILVKEVIDKLKKLQKQLPDESTQQEISLICSELQNTKEDGDWKEITQFIPEFNSTFFRNLLKDFPDLSVNERRLCALLNMNMTSKEISEITKQSPHSINIARCRLRNKLKLTGKQESIQEFLSQYNNEV